MKVVKPIHNEMDIQDLKQWITENSFNVKDQAGNKMVVIDVEELRAFMGKDTNAPETSDGNIDMAAVSGSAIQEKYDELCKEITRLQEKYDENGYDFSPMIKLQRIEQHVDMIIYTYS